jgi:hypothetical protein
MSALSASLIASAAVAIATTLVVEYAAKPTLEARKERILDKARSSRTLLTQLLMLESRISILPDELRPGFREQKEAVNRISDEIRELAATNPLMMTVLPSEIGTMVMIECGHIVGFLVGYKRGWKE